MLKVLSVSYPLAKVSPCTAGGAEQVLSMLDQELVSAGHHSIVLAPAGSHCEGLLIPAQVAAGNLDQSAKVEARRVFKHLLKLTLQRYSIDVVHMHGLDFVEYLPESDVPVIVSLHLPLSWYVAGALCSARYSHSTTLVCVSNAQAQTAPREVQPLRVINNGVDLDVFHPTSARGDFVVALGRICPEKGLHLAIDAAKIAGVDLILAGSVYDYPEHRKYFEQMIRPRLNHHAKFVGLVGGIRKAELLSGARCLLVPSQTSETSSLVAMEAFACGTPVIAWHNGALAEIVSHGRTGFLVNSVEQMADAIANVSSIDRAKCRSEAKKRFSSKAMADRYIQLYESVASQTHVSELQAA
jgi:glycosyltransferase involved in cell wall biosynthesis